MSKLKLVAKAEPVWDLHWGNGPGAGNSSHSGSSLTPAFGTAVLETGSGLTPASAAVVLESTIGLSASLEAFRCRLFYSAGLDGPTNSSQDTRILFGVKLQRFGRFGLHFGGRLLRLGDSLQSDLIFLAKSLLLGGSCCRYRFIFGYFGSCDFNVFFVIVIEDWRFNTRAFWCGATSVLFWCSATSVRFCCDAASVRFCCDVARVSRGGRIRLRG